MINNWLQRTAITAALLGLLNAQGLSWLDHRMVIALALLWLLQWLTLGQALSLSIAAVMQIPRNKLLQIKTLFEAQAQGRAVDPAEVRKILETPEDR